MRRLLLTLLFSVLVPYSGISAQAGRLRCALQGTVLDANRSPLPGARILAVADGGGATASTVSDRSGQFTLRLEPGRYTIAISADGFVEVRRQIDLVRDSERREFVLPVAGIQESVSVSAAADAGGTLISSGTRIATPIRDVPQSITVVSKEQIHDQLMMSVGDVVRYVPSICSAPGSIRR